MCHHLARIRELIQEPDNFRYLGNQNTQNSSHEYSKQIYLSHDEKHTGRGAGVSSVYGVRGAGQELPVRAPLRLQPPHPPRLSDAAVSASERVPHVQVTHQEGRPPPLRLRLEGLKRGTSCVHTVSVMCPKLTSTLTFIYFVL